MLWLVCFDCSLFLFSDSAKGQQDILAGDGSFQISQLLMKLYRSTAQNRILIDELAPDIGKDGSDSKKRRGLLTDSTKEKLERRNKAMARQKKILEEFMLKQEVFKEQLTTSSSTGSNNYF